jgi:hypothetical protein
MPAVEAFEKISRDAHKIVKCPGFEALFLDCKLFGCQHIAVG